MKRIELLLLAATSFAVPACSNGPSTTGGDDDGSGSGSGDQWDQALAARKPDYNAALRIAALRLTGDVPTMIEINQVATAPDDAAKKVAYETLITDYIARPTFARQMYAFWQDSFKMGTDKAAVATPPVSIDTAGALAAKISVENGSYMGLFTLGSGNCPTFDGTTFTAAECANGAPKQAGVLTNPGMNYLYTSNLAFRRTRWVQETFACVKFPAEVNPQGTDVGGAALYTGMYPFQSISGTTNGGGRVNFLDTSAVICANCHSNINHIAPLFANFDMNGAYQPQIAVTLPLNGSPLAKMTDYLPPGEPTGWRHDKPAADLGELGAVMAADPAVAACGVARIWNWALGKTDIVDTLQEVPSDVIQAQVDAFTSSGFLLKDMIHAVFISDDFTKF
jgi:hypothetical protein